MKDIIKPKVLFINSNKKQKIPENYLVSRNSFFFNDECSEFSFIKEDDSNKQTSKNQVLEQVTLGLKEINQSLGTNYRLSKIYYLPSESSSDFVYKFLIMKLIRHYHHGNEFKVT